jgi:parallel beta-helix repeat protein
MALSITTSATNFYVSPSGSPSNNGLTPATALIDIGQAGLLTQPGDTVFVMSGTYTNPDSNSNVVDIWRSGTAGHPIVYTNYPGDTPLIRSGNWAGIQVQGADYIVIDGFTVVGYNDSVTLAYAQAQENNTDNPLTAGNGIGCAPKYGNDSIKAHHVAIRNCKVSKCGGAGIYSDRSDYLDIENNTVSECGWYSPYGNSGISLYQNWNSDSAAGIKNYVIGNTCFGNQNLIPFYAVGSITDGNGIIIDDARNTQNGSTLGVYLGRTYVANNVVYGNGGRGIHCYLSDRVTIVNNTCYHNCQSPYVHDGEYTSYGTDSVYFVNNIASPDMGIPPIDTGVITTHLTVAYNLWTANDSPATPLGTNTVMGPANFTNPSTGASADFHLLAGSAAIGAGTHMYAPATDKDGDTRPALDAVDIGAYRFQALAGIVSMAEMGAALRVYPNPAQNTLMLALPNNAPAAVDIVIYDLSGRVVENTSRSIDTPSYIDIAGLAGGPYLIKAHDGNHQYLPTIFVKED